MPPLDVAKEDTVCRPHKNVFIVRKGNHSAGNMSGIYGFFRSYFHSPPVSKLNESKENRNKTVEDDYSIFLDTTIAFIDMPRNSRIDML